AEGKRRLRIGTVMPRYTARIPASRLGGNLAIGVGEQEILAHRRRIIARGKARRRAEVLHIVEMRGKIGRADIIEVPVAIAEQPAPAFLDEAFVINADGVGGLAIDEAIALGHIGSAL